jgi:hypothetical protein
VIFVTDKPTDWRALCAELADALDEWRLGGGPPEDTADADLIARARAALAQPEPEGVGPSLAEIAQLTWQHSSDLGDLRIGVAPDDVPALVAAALARWARPTIRPKGTCQPNGYAYRYPAIDGTITRFNHGQEVNGCRPLYAIPYWLGQPPTARPTIEPVPVAERLPGAEDCDGCGNCWWFRPATRDDFPFWWFGGGDNVSTHWLPHHALPIPTTH